ncbi:MAG: DUF4399 domain-containing protein [Halobacteria archaeon]|nr:DUF4399 domain-containing protein [Halobacteria archaeon]
MLVKPLIGIVTLAFFVTGPVLARTPSPEGAHVYIISPAHGEVVNNPVTVRFGLNGMGVAPAGIDKPGTGHHHLLIDVPSRPAVDKPLPADANHKHFGGGQTQTTIELSPGTHTLQLIMGDKTHIPHKPTVISEKITIMVK